MSIIDRIREYRDVQRIKDNPCLIRSFSSPSEKLQLSAVQADPLSIQYIKHPTERVQHEVLLHGEEHIIRINNPSLSSLLHVAKNAPEYLIYAKIDEDTQKELIDIYPECRDYILNDSPEKNITMFEKDPEGFKRLSPTEHQLECVYFSISPNDTKKMETFLSDIDLPAELELRVVGDNVENFKYIKSPTSHATSVAIDKLTGAQLYGKELSPQVAGSTQKLIRNLDEAYKTSRMPLSRSDREALNHLDLGLDDFEIRQNEYAIRLHNIYKAFSSETGIQPDPDRYLEKEKEQLRLHASKKHDLWFDEENLTAEGLNRYEDCLTRKKAMDSVNALSSGKTDYISDILRSYGIDPSGVSRELKDNLAKGKPIHVNGSQMLMRVKTPAGYAFKLYNSQKIPNNQIEM